MNSADSLVAHDRCARAAVWGQKWIAPAIHPTQLLREAIDVGLTTESDDPGQAAGDHFFTTATERVLDVPGSQYQSALHHAALADVVTTAIRALGATWARVEDRKMKDLTWVSNAYVEGGIRLRRVVVVDRWSRERELAEKHSWRTLGEMAVYELPMTLTVVLIGQMRDGHHHSPWSKGHLHPRSRNLRIRKRSGESFDEKWTECWRETADIPRDTWLEQMQADGVMPDVLFHRDLEAPCPEFAAKIRHLAETKMAAIRDAKETPPPTISACDFPVPCAFRRCCWETFSPPSEHNAFVAI